MQFHVEVFATVEEQGEIVPDTTKTLASYTIEATSSWQARNEGAARYSADHAATSPNDYFVMAHPV